MLIRITGSANLYQYTYCTVMESVSKSVSESVSESVDD